MDAEHIEVFINRNLDMDKGVKALTTDTVESVDTRIKQLHKKEGYQSPKEAIVVKVDYDNRPSEED